MQKRIYTLLILLVVLILPACNLNNPPAPYPYNKNPQLNWGYALFYGSYYKNYDNPNNVLTINAFSEKLFINDNSSLEGTGQYLIIEDIFIAPTDTFLTPGIYQVSDSGEPFTFWGGKKFKDNLSTIPSGAYMYYIEHEPLRSKMEYIIDGSLKVEHDETGIYTISGELQFEDKSTITLKFKGELPHIDQEAKTTESSIREHLRLKLKHAIN